MSTEREIDLKIEIAHVLLIDIVGYSKLLVNEQIEVLDQLNRLVRSRPCFQAAESAGKLMRLPTGDGMALLFFDNPEAPVQCAVEISAAMREYPHLQIRMGAHSGPIKEVVDVNDRSNFAGSGINMAQRVLDCGDGGHILLSGHLAEDLLPYEHWHRHLQDLGECEVKHGVKLRLFNLCKDGLGNPAVPQKLLAQRRAAAGVKGWWSSLSHARRIVLAAVAILLFLTAAVAAWRYLREAGRSGAPEKSIAVLPFANLSDEPANAYFADGVHDEILTHLSKLSAIKVISRTSVMRYKPGGDWKIKSVGRELGVAHLLEGTVQRIDNRVRVNAQLIDANTDRHLWASSYDRELSDVFAIQSEIAGEIVAQLKGQLSPSEKAALQDPPTANLVAYERYVRGKSLIDGAVFSARGTEDLIEAAQLLKEAVALDPSFYLAFYQLAHAHDQLYLRTAASRQHIELAEAAIQSLRSLRPDSGEAHLALAKHLHWVYSDFPRARQELDLAGAMLPNDPTVPLLRGYIQRRQGQWEDSTRSLNRALELDPTNYFILQQLSLTWQNRRQFAEMAATLERAAALAPADLSVGARRALVELEWRANTKPLHDFFASARTSRPGTALGVIADEWLYLALCEGDLEAARDALDLLGTDACGTDFLPFPRGWCEGLVARLGGDETAAQQAFVQARTEMEKTVTEQPESPAAHAVLGMLEAASGRDRARAIQHGERAVQLMPVSKDAVHGAALLTHLAAIYAWSGEPERALEKLTLASSIPSRVSYGNLRLHPQWDPLRDHPRFEQLVESLAPK